MNTRKITIRLVPIPDFAEDEYNPGHIECYAKMTELVYRALNLGSIGDFLKEFIAILNIREDIEVRIMRLPSYRSKVFGMDNKGKILDEQLHGRSWKNRPLIDVYPDRLFPDKLSKPLLSVGLRGFILNSSIRTIIHEVLHKSGLNDETRVRELAKHYYKNFRRKHIQAFDDELKPLLKEWKQFNERNGELSQRAR
jgi:hypothetical protein